MSNDTFQWMNREVLYLKIIYLAFKTSPLTNDWPLMEYLFVNSYISWVLLGYLTKFVVDRVLISPRVLLGPIGFSFYQLCYLTIPRRFCRVVGNSPIRGRLVWRYPWSLNRRISNWRKRETKNFMNVLGQRRGWSLPLPLSSTTLAAKQWTRSHSNLFRCWLDFIVFYLVTSIT